VHPFLNDPAVLGLVCGEVRIAAYRRINAATHEEVISSLSLFFLTLFLIIGSEFDQSHSICSR